MAITEQNINLWRTISGTIAAVLLTGQASIIGWLAISLDNLRDAHQETDRTQEAVLQRLNSIESQQVMMDTQVRLIPAQINDDDRWTAKEELQYQSYIDDRFESIIDRIRRIEEAHKTHSSHRGYVDIH